jgi:hypothetical protein
VNSMARSASAAAAVSIIGDLAIRRGMGMGDRRNVTMSQASIRLPVLAASWRDPETSTPRASRTATQPPDA